MSDFTVESNDLVKALKENNSDVVFMLDSIAKRVDDVAKQLELLNGKIQINILKGNQE